MKHTRVPLALIATVAASSLALTACGGGDDADSKPKSAPKATALDINQQDPAKLKQGGTLNWAVDQFSTQWNSLEIDGQQASTGDVVESVMPSLWHSSASGKQVPNKAFLLDAKSETKGGKQVVTFHLNPKAKWSDGTPITYKDLKANVEAMSGKDKAYKIASSAGYEEVSSVEKGKDDYEAILTFDTPFADWQSLFSAPNNTPLYPAKYVSDPEKFNTAYINKMPVTANAFKVGSIDKTAQTITVVADLKWWGDKPKLDKIVFHAMENGSMPAAFANGEIDYFNVGGDPSAYKQAAAVKSGEIREAGGPNYRVFAFNGKSEKLKDPRVRQALFMATDRKTLAESNLKGLNWPAKTMDNHLLVPNQKGYQDNSADLGKYDPKGAAKLLDEAGWKLHGKVREKDGKKLSLRFVIPSGVPGAKNEGTILTQLYGQIGVKLDVQTVATNEFFDKYITPGDFDVSPYSMMGTPFAATGASNIYLSNGGNNDARVGSKKLDDLMKKAGHTIDPTESLKVVNQADAEAWKIAGMLPIYQRPDIIALKKSLANLGAQGMSDITYEHIGYMK
ncbi:ABC transporter family substrate-binding protein [Streptomyces niger]|uniref:ABC transporter family substrate-binding protein n=1 Tax=Streptomyces niger TaxID=66373 RepID=UPI000A74DF93|nr:ABC transporter family substrate-binding protein [Streptomyces niger]